MNFAMRFAGGLAKAVNRQHSQFATKRQMPWPVVCPICHPAVYPTINEPQAQTRLASRVIWAFSTFETGQFSFAPCASS